MQFGRVDHLEEIDFKLPEDHSSIGSILGGISRTPKVYVGCAKWGRPDWIGKIYPKGAKEKDFLSHYVNHFGCIELNATHYRVFGKPTIEKWRSTVLDDFKFCPKFTNTISHFKRLRSAQEETILFYEQIKGFEDKLGPCFLQLHHILDQKNWKLF